MSQPKWFNRCLQHTLPNYRIKILLKCTEVFTKINHILYHKISLNRLERIETTQSMFSDHKEIKLETNKINMWKILKYLEIKWYTFNYLMNQWKSQKKLENI